MLAHWCLDPSGGCPALFRAARRALPGAAALVLAAAVAPAARAVHPAPPTVDGTRDAVYGTTLSVQTLQTFFGDNNLGVLDFSNGSELDSLSAVIVGDTLYLFIAGNLESNFNKLEIFIDSIPGGQNQLRGDNADIDFNGLNRMGYSGPSTPGLKFDAGFEADRYISLAGGNNPYRFFVTYAELATTGGAPGYFAGSTAPAGNGELTGGNNPFGIRATIDNSNTAGVTFGSGPASGAGVNTGVELAIPLAALGNPAPCGSIKVCAFVNSIGHDSVSNQVLAPLPDTFANLTEPRTVDFSAYAGDQFVQFAASAPPQIATHPADTLGCPPAAATLSVAATGAGPLTYAWRKGGVTIDAGVNPSAATPTLTLASDAAEEGSYDCIVTDACARNIISSSAAYTVGIATGVSQHPTSLRKCPSAAAAFTVTATGTGTLAYLWQYQDAGSESGWSPMTENGLISAGQTTGVTSATLQVTALAASQTSVVRCRITGVCGTVFSDPATLTVSCPNKADVAGFGGSPGCDGQVTVDDIVFYLAQFFSGGTAVADLVGPGGSAGPDGSVTVDDLVAFLSAFFTACP